MVNSIRSCVLAVCVAVVPRAVAAQPFVYVANASSDDVTVIDGATNTVVTTIDVGDEPRNPAVSPDGTRVYVPNRFDDSVTVIDGTTNTVLTTILDNPVGTFDEPYAAAVSPDGSRAYVINKAGDSLTVIDTSNNSIVTTEPDACFDSPEWVTVNHAGTRVYVVSKDGDRVCIVSAATNSVIGSVDVGMEPRSAVVTCDDAFLYVANNRPDLGGPDVTKIRLSDNFTTPINFPGADDPYRPRNMSLTPDGTKIYVGLQPEDAETALGVIRTSNDATSVVDLADDQSLYGTAVIRTGARVFVTDEDDDEVHVVQVNSDTELTDAGLPIPAGSTPHGIATAFSCGAGTAPVPLLSWPALALTAVLLGALGMLRRRIAVR